MGEYGEGGTPTQKTKGPREISRREFLRTGTAATLAALLLSGSSRRSERPQQELRENNLEAYFSQKADRLKETIERNWQKALLNWSFPFPYNGASYFLRSNVSPPPEDVYLPDLKPGNPLGLQKALQVYQEKGEVYIPTGQESGIGKQLAHLSQEKGNFYLNFKMRNPLNGHEFYASFYKGKNTEKLEKSKGLVVYFRGIDRSDADSLYLSLINEGYDVLVVGYAGRLADNTTPILEFDLRDGIQAKDILPNLKEVEKLNFREFEDGATALLLLQKLGLVKKSETVHTIGVSYGSTQAVNFSILAEKLGFSLGKTVLYAGIHNWGRVRKEYANLLKPLPFTRRKLLFSPKMLREWWRQFQLLSPATTLPTLKPKTEVVIIHGKEDRIVSPDHSVELSQKLKQTGIRQQLYLLPHLPHVIRAEDLEEFAQMPPEQIRQEIQNEPQMNPLEKKKLEELLVQAGEKLRQDEGQAESSFFRTHFLLSLGGFTN